MIQIRRWTKIDQERLLESFRSGLPCRRIADLLGRTESSVRLKLLGLGLSSKRFSGSEATEEFGNNPLDFGFASVPDQAEETGNPEQIAIRMRAEREIENRERRMEDRQAVDEAKSEILAERIASELLEHLRELPAKIEVVLPEVPERKVSDHTAVLVVGDSHIGQVVDPRESDGICDYNPAIMLARIWHLLAEVRRILENDPPKKLLLLFAGDIVHGNLGHTAEDDLTLPIAIQMDLALHTFFPFVCAVSALAPTVDIAGAAGNHGRLLGAKKMPTDRRWSNLDSIFYSSLAALIEAAGPQNIFFDRRISSRRTIEVDGHWIELMHGDEVRGGNFALAGMSREVGNATLRNVQRGRPAPDLYVIGDKHFSASIPFGSGNFLVNGSVVGPDNFGLNFAASPPSQTLFFVRPGLGRTTTHIIRLDGAEPIHPPPLIQKPHLLPWITKYQHQ